MSIGQIHHRGLGALPPIRQYLLYTVLGIGCLGVVCWGVLNSLGRSVRVKEDDGLMARILNAEELAHAFIEETNVEKRLSYALNPEGVRGHLTSYTEQARSHPAQELKAMGHSEHGGRAVSSFAVKFADGSFRMLSIVQTDDGTKVDWDSYARYCSASWEDLFSGGAEEAEVRVFARPGDYYVGHFRDRGQWTCFKLETPDCDRSIYAYAPAGSDLSKRMQAYVMKSRNFRQHMTLKIRTEAESGKEGQFVIEELLAMGWVKG